MTKILVTGSKGFIGKQVVEHLKSSDIISDSIDSKRVDLKNIEEVMKLNKSDIVIHLGGKTIKGLEWNEYFYNNVIGTLNILEYCIKKNIKKMIFVSSYVYGNPKYSPIDEKHPILPHNAYTRSKYLAEQLCEFFAKNSDLNVIILRPFNIFGKTLPKGFLISNLLKSIKTNEKITIVNKNSRRDFLHVDDLTDVILKIKDYDCKFEIFNIGSGKSYSFNEIIEKIEKIKKIKLNVQYEEDKENFIEDIVADISKLKNKIKWNPMISFDEGLQKCK
ncbi:UDP-glucose 4-epimerase [Nitrosopumilus zosterae]|uniref:UDP-glucose 4-epimerase n=1 Tax=Nitrosopumilus zosterae TaxID=718286 RepID=A0A2S2KUF3_9ARCH|nr:NAD-dependent epimerase/dehydratase family protein [Nitrosopumilus zosterae]BDQ31837.1 NAD-dependent epimerase/dehydratase family protein [Nitrosopumilus zosterae]GBH35187.1 UDP-glucose 4-epimerase [Nitrosopumilus zosterae]